jgi:site-specific DNA recombinase
VLLSFAQFEREVIGERIRDKVSASNRKGIWMGGALPLGYDVHQHKLIVNRDEARSTQLVNCCGYPNRSDRFFATAETGQTG